MTQALEESRSQRTSLLGRRNLWLKYQFSL